MSAVDFAPESDLFVADDVIKTAKELHANLIGLEPELQQRFAVEAIEILGDPRELYGGNRIYVHAFGALVLAQNLSLDEMLYHGTYFGDVTFHANFSRFAYIQHPMFRGLSLRLFEATVLASSSNPEFEGEHIVSGVFAPVTAVESTFAA